MRVACAVLAWNVYASGRDELLRTTLETIQEPGWPVILVDNGSSDETADLVRRLGGLRNPGPNLTIGAGMNLAIEAVVASGADLVVFSNDDIRWRPGWGAELEAFWKAAPGDIGICGGLLERATWAWNTPIAAYTIGGVHVLERVSCPSGAWTFRADVWPRMGPVPDHSRAGWNDVPVSRKLRASGYRLVCADWSEHLGEQQSAWGNRAHESGKSLDLGSWGFEERPGRAPEPTVHGGARGRGSLPQKQRATVSAPASSLSGSGRGSPGPMHVCTVITRNRLAHARALARSFAEHHPGSTFHALVLDPGPPLREGAEPFEVLTPGELFTPEEWGPMWLAYSVMELARAAKPRVLSYILDRYGETATHLDGDTRVYQPMEWLVGLSVEHGLILTPHTVHPIPGYDRHPTELDVLRTGVYNAGLISVGQAGRPFLDWLWSRVQRQCLMAPESGLFAEQRWLDLAPALFECHILKDPTVNVANWNLDTRQLAISDDCYLVDGKPLTLFHFSGYDPHAPWQLSRHGGRWQRALLSENPALRRLCDEYRAELLAAGYDEVSRCTLDQVTLPDGVVLDERARRIFRNSVTPLDPARTQPGVPNPITEPRELVAWLREPAWPDHPAWLSRYLFRLYRETRKLARALPRVPGEDAPRLLAWVRSHGASEAVPSALMPSEQDGPLPGRSPQPVGEGVNVVGYLGAEVGLGEAARQLVGALQAQGVPLATFIYSPGRLRHRQESGFVDLKPVPGLVNPFDLNIICLNGPETERFAGEMGAGFFSGRYTVGYWAWELEEFPAAWSEAFDIVDEVWMNSEFAATGMRGQTGKPVRVLPVPVRAPVPSAVGRSGFGLPDGFMFLFVFDYGSEFERKNPVSLVQAFKRAFTPGEGPLLVVKSVRGETRPDQRERLRYEAGDRHDVVLVEDYFSPADKDALMATCDCYVSLHRSEGFGLTMAEAMALGKPTIATGYSGNLEFMTPENSFLVGFSMGRVPADCGPFREGAVWAEPDLEKAAALMRRVYEDPETARRVGERARADMALLHGPEARGRLLGELLGDARQQMRAGARRGEAASGRLATGRDRDKRGSPTRRAKAPEAASARRATDIVGKEEFAGAKHDLLWLLRRLDKPPLGWLLRRRKGYRKLRDRWLGSG